MRCRSSCHCLHLHTVLPRLVATIKHADLYFYHERTFWFFARGLRRFGECELELKSRRVTSGCSTWLIDNSVMKEGRVLDYGVWMGCFRVVYWLRKGSLMSSSVCI